MRLSLTSPMQHAIMGQRQQPEAADVAQRS
jgi:hypothetical protein